MSEHRIVKPNNQYLERVYNEAVEWKDKYPSQYRRALIEYKLLSSTLKIWQINIMDDVSQFTKWQFMPDLQQIDIDEMYYIFLTEFPTSD